MKVGLFLHAYQPPIQLPPVTKRIAQQSYIPIIKALLNNKKAKITMNIAGSLTEQLVQLSEYELLNQVGYAATQGQLELVSSAMFHPLLTHLPNDEIIRQRQLNDEINLRVFGENVYSPRGFFLPEMVYDHRVGEVLSSDGVEWLLLDESAYPNAGYQEDWHSDSHFDRHVSRGLNKIKGLSTFVFFRDRPISLTIAFNGDLKVTQIIEDIRRHFLDGQESYVILAMDAETFGHHHPHNLTLLEDLMNEESIEMVTMSELTSTIDQITEVSPVVSTWGIAVEGSEGKPIFPRWDNPDNPIHALQWELFNLAVSVRSHTSNIPDNLDRGVNSDQFWWASANPCWYPEMIRRGADFLRQSIYQSVLSSPEQKQLADELVQSIVNVGTAMYGSHVQGC
ncbi:hypothetical protein HGA91_02250 [candidate division WWE3 bacterium]|nr:hypothetical protein [candidate division WWE3 bacterium]